jgi:hypothetical protein
VEKCCNYFRDEAKTGWKFLRIYKIIYCVRVFMYSYLRVDKIKISGKQITLNDN